MYSSIQDFGRIGFQDYGVPYSGVMDRYAASLANTLVGNLETEAVLEITMVGPKLKFHCSSVICISGADLTPRINGHDIPLNKAIAVHSFDVLSFGGLRQGLRSYLAVSGGIKSEFKMGSYSMFKGITATNTIADSGTIDIMEVDRLPQTQNASFKINTSYLIAEHIEVFKGPEYKNLTKDQQQILNSSTFKISKDNNRMACQLEAPLANQLTPIITAPVIPGTVQLTPSGKLIILMRDCQTTGGYPRIFQLKESALNIMAQKLTGQNIKFKLID